MSVRCHGEQCGANSTPRVAIKWRSRKTSGTSSTMAQRTSATVPMSFEQMAALDRLVAAEPPSYPAASRASVVRALIEEADRKLAKASAKRSEAA